MELTYYGNSSLSIATKGLVIHLNPVAGTKEKYDLALFTEPQSEEILTSQPFAIDMPGEYEIKNISIQGIAAKPHASGESENKNCTIYAIQAGSIHLAVLGNIAPELTEAQRDLLGAINVLAIPIGGHGLTLDAEAAVKIVGQLEPQFVIPIHYDDGATQYPVPQDKLDTFLKEMGSQDAAAKNSLKISHKELDTDTTQVVVLSAQRA